jgi:hypothetical protein
VGCIRARPRVIGTGRAMAPIVVVVLLTGGTGLVRLVISEER